MAINYNGEPITTSIMILKFMITGLMGQNNDTSLAFHTFNH